MANDKEQRETFSNVQSLDAPVATVPSSDGQETFTGVKALPGVEQPPQPLVHDYQTAPADAKASAASPIAPPPVQRPTVNMQEESLPEVLVGHHTLSDEERKTFSAKPFPNLPDPVADFKQGSKIMTEASSKFGRDLGHAYVEGAVNQKGPGGGYFIPSVSEHPLTEEQVKQQHPIAYGVAGGVGGFAGGFVSDPVNVAMLASGAEGPVFLRKAADLYFAAEGAKGVRNQFLDLAKNWDNMTQDQKAEALTDASLQAFLTTAAGKDLAKGTLHPTKEALSSAKDYITDRATGKGKLIPSVIDTPVKTGIVRRTTGYKTVVNPEMFSPNNLPNKGVTGASRVETQSGIGKIGEYREPTPSAPVLDWVDNSFVPDELRAAPVPEAKLSIGRVGYATPTEFNPSETPITKEKVDEVRSGQTAHDQEKSKEATPQQESFRGEYAGDVEDRVSSLSNADLKKLGNALSLDTGSYDFSKRESLREGGSKHPVQRIQLVKDIMSKLTPEQIEQLGFQNKVTQENVVGGEAARSAKSNAEVSRKILSHLWEKPESTPDYDNLFKDALAAGPSWTSEKAADVASTLNKTPNADFEVRGSLSEAGRVSDNDVDIWQKTGDLKDAAPALKKLGFKFSHKTPHGEVWTNGARAIDLWDSAHEPKPGFGRAKVFDKGGKVTVEEPEELVPTRKSAGPFGSVREMPKEPAFSKQLHRVARTVGLSDSTLDGMKNVGLSERAVLEMLLTQSAPALIKQFGR